MKNTSNTPRSSRPVKAMNDFFGSGFQRGVWLYLPWNVSRLAPPPAEPITKICGEPWRLETKAIWPPSGENDGELSMVGLFVSRDLMLPSLGLIRYSSELP